VEKRNISPCRCTSISGVSICSIYYHPARALLGLPGSNKNLPEA
jgi:hypothetical protein